MLRASIVLFTIGLIAMVFGIYDVAGMSFELGRLLLLFCLGLAVVGFIAALVTGRKITPPL